MSGWSDSYTDSSYNTSYDTGSYGSGFGGASTLQAPSYETFLPNAGPAPGSLVGAQGGQLDPADAYYQNAVSVPSAPAAMYHENQPTFQRPPATAHPTAPKPSFGASGFIEGMEQSQWQNRDNATNCSLCEAPFSTLSKRKVRLPVP
jgi:hypothetical protein